MKFLTLLFVLVFSFATFADVCLEGRSISKDNLGNITPSEGEKCFENVYNKNGSALVKGAVVVMDETEADGYSINVSATAGKNPRCVLVEACAASAICKCQTYGFIDIALVKATEIPSIGSVLFISEASAGYLAVNSSSDNDIDTPVGYSLELVTVDGAKKVFLKLR